MYTRSYKLYVALLLLVVYIFNQTDRLIFGFLMEPIKHEFVLSDSQLGFLAGPALVVFYALLGIPLARLADRGNRVTIMAIAIALWSAMVMLSACVTSFSQLALTRVSVGIGEAGFSAIALSVIADYHTAAERTRALAIFVLGVPLGAAFSSALGGWINQAYGWRMAFLIAGLPGIALALLVKGTIKEPPVDHMSVVGRAAVEQVPAFRSVLRVLWQRRALRHMAIAMALFNLFTASMLVWLPTFFVRIHGMPTGKLGLWFGLATGFGGGVGVTLSGTLTQRVGMQRERAQAKILAASAVLVWLLMMVVLLLPETYFALSLMLVASVPMYFFFAPSCALVQGLCTSNMRATMIAIVILAQTLAAGVLGLQIIGFLSDAFAARFGIGALRWALVVICSAAPWAAIHFWLASRSIRGDGVAASGDGEPLLKAEHVGLSV